MQLATVPFSTPGEDPLSARLRARAILRNTMKPTVFIDGHNGSTGLRIREWLAGREDLNLLVLPESQRKDTKSRRDALHGADVAILCLPDGVVKETAAWLRDAPTRIIDASSAHRVDSAWVYGMPELSASQREAIGEAKWVTNPGCYPTTVILCMRPLLEAGVLEPGMPLVVHALSGYSGGGRGLIEHWEDQKQGLRSLAFEAPYALERVHKHIPEMIEYSGLIHEPQFLPAVGPFRCGMRVQVSLPAPLLAKTDAQAIWRTLHERYDNEPFVSLAPLDDPPERDERSFDPQRCNGTNVLELRVLPHPSGHVMIMGILDNLGKGASGAAVQNLNIMLGLTETAGLTPTTQQDWATNAPEPHPDTAMAAAAGARS